MSVIRIKDESGNWIPLNQVIKATSPPTLVTSTNYIIPVSGGNYWIDTTLATIRTNLILPLAPDKGTRVSIQIIDNGIKDLYLTPQTPDKIGFQINGMSGKYSNPSRNLLEILTYYNGNWLPGYGRLTYQVLA